MMLLIALLLWLILLGVTSVLSYWFMPADTATGLWQGVVYVLAPVTAVCAGLIAVRQFKIMSEQGRALLVIVLGVAGWAVGEALWTYYDLVAHSDPFPSLADIFYLLGYVAFTIGIVLEIRFLRGHGTSSVPKPQLFLLSLVATMLMGIAAYFGIYLAIQPEYSIFENVIAISYGMADVVLVVLGLVVALITWEMRGGKLATPWWWFLIGLTLTFVADIGFAMFTPEYEMAEGFYKPILDTVWIVGYLAFAYGFALQAWLIYSVQDYLRLQHSVTKMHARTKQSTR